MLFHEIYSSYYLASASILKEAVRRSLTNRKMNDLVRQYAFGESLLTIPEGMKGEKWRLLYKDLSTPLQHEPEMPLTLLEKRWMKAMLLDPRIRLFKPDMAGLENIEPLFMPDMVVYYDRYSDGDDYRDPDYIRNFDTILQALRENRDLYISFKSRLGAQPNLVVTPYYLEYSEKDDRFRLVARRYRVTLKYDRQDETEMVIRILSFGSAIRVVEPDHFIELLRERIEKQKGLKQGDGSSFRSGKTGDGSSFHLCHRQTILE